MKNKKQQKVVIISQRLSPDKTKQQVLVVSKVLRTKEEQQLGYQFLDKEDISPNECLLFVFDEERNDRTFHMRNCNSFDIQVYALDANKKLVDAFPMSRGSKDTYPIKGPCKFVVEVPIQQEEVTGL